MSKPGEMDALVSELSSGSKSRAGGEMKTKMKAKMTQESERTNRAQAAGRKSLDFRGFAILHTNLRSGALAQMPFSPLCGGKPESGEAHTGFFVIPQGEQWSIVDSSGVVSVADGPKSVFCVNAKLTRRRVSTRSSYRNGDESAQPTD